MRLKHLLAVAAASLGASPAFAAPAFVVTATYEPFFSADTTFSVSNTSSATETDVTLISGAATELLGTIAAGAAASYAFNELSGPFVVEPGDEGVPDVTSYQVSAVLLGRTLTTAAFSPVTNLTGGYVDFLGDCYEDSVGCSVDPTATYPLGAVVASVPEPMASALLAAGLIGLGALRRRPA